MVRLSDRQSLLHRTFIFLLLTQSSADLSQTTIVAIVGDDVVLPCHLQPAEDTFGKTVEWWTDFKFLVWHDDPKEVYEKHPSYTGRTSLFINKLKYGDFSLKLTNVTASDAETYKCVFSTKGVISVIQLDVCAVSSRVIVAIEGTDTGVNLHCKSEGWDPKPEMLWLDGKGNLLPAGSTKAVRGPDELYTVSSRLMVEKSSGDTFTCRIRQKKTNQTRETQIRIPADFILVSTGGLSTCCWIIITEAVIVIVTLIVLVLCCCMCKRIQR